MKLLTVLCNDDINYKSDKVSFIKLNSKDINHIIKFCNSKYFLFIKNYDNTVEGFLDKIINKCNEEFDACYIDYSIEVNGSIRHLSEDDYDLSRKPNVGCYLWSYIFNRKKLEEFINSEKKEDDLKRIFDKVTCINEIMYHHVPSKRLINDFIYPDEHDEVKLKNVIYVGDFCNGRFNGYITWIKNIGRCFSNDYEIVIMADKIYGPTKEAFEKFFKVVIRREDTNYLIDRLLVTYSTFFYPNNIICMDESYMFIHGNMADYKSTRHFTRDIYTRYIAVSKVAMEKAKGYFKTDTISYIHNPIKLSDDQIKPHLKLVSAQRECEVKKTDRIRKIATILDEENIPYTWNLFSDANVPDKVLGGLIYRSPIENTIPYIKDADYYVQLSDSEAYSYSVLEAIYLNTKIVVTPLECYDEMNMDKDTSIVIPFEYFEDQNKEKLRSLVLKMYKNIDKQYENNLPDDFNEYRDLFIK